MTDLSDLQAGDLAFGPIGGAAGALVAAGQMIVAPWKHQLTWKRWWKIRHCGVVVRDVGAYPLLVQAEPGGVQIVDMTPGRYWTKDWIYIRPRYAAGQAARVAEVAHRQADKRIPYAFECYPGILAHRTHLPIPGLDDWLSRVDSDGDPVRVICSWEVDTALTLAGYHVFNDGRVPHDVVPSELYLRLLEIGPAEVIQPNGLGYMPSAAVRAMSGPRPIPRYLL